MFREIVSRSDCEVLLNACAGFKSAEWDTVCDRFLRLCEGIWKAVKAVLCFDAPEGTNLIDEDNDDLDIGAKDTLSYCWRALKDSRFLKYIQFISEEFTLTLVACCCTV